MASSNEKKVSAHVFHLIDQSKLLVVVVSVLISPTPVGMREGQMSIQRVMVAYTVMRIMATACPDLAPPLATKVIVESDQFSPTRQAFL